MIILYIEYIVFGLVLLASNMATYILAKKLPRQPNGIKPKTTLKSTVQRSSMMVLNHWKLEVNGNAKFDIKVEWSNGDAMVFSGQAPEVYEVDRKRGVVPINTAGIPPEWADDGISYQWHLNNNLWC
jgi:tRNA U34 2-thiouridine synthase MnmA/TrmU